MRANGIFPLLDELALIKSLLDPVSLENIDLVRSGSVLAIVDAFDRRMSRPVFLEVVSNAMPLYDWLGCLRIMRMLLRSLTAGKLTPDELGHAITEYITKAENSRDVLLRTMKGVVACAPSDATIH